MSNDTIALQQECHAARSLTTRWLALLAPLGGLELSTASILLMLLEKGDQELETEFVALAALAGLSPSNARRLSLHLANLGWIKLKTVPDDRLRISMTESGRQFALRLL